MKKLSIFLALFVAISFVSCNKQNKEFLLGDWELMSKPNDELDYIWSFTETNVTVMATDADENDGPQGDLDTCAAGSYILKNGVLTLALPEQPCSGSVYNGDWDIQNLSKDFLTVRRETAFGTQWYEFQKQE